MMIMKRIVVASLLACACLGGLARPAAARGPASQGSSASSSAPSPSLLAEVREAIEGALTVPDSRVEVVGVDQQAADCQPARARSGAATPFEIPNPVEGSGRVAIKAVGVRSSGEACQLWLWAHVRIMAQVPVARRSIRAGDTLADAVTLEEREIHPGHSPVAICDGCVADRFVGAGQVVESVAVRAPGLRTGEPIKVILVSGALLAEQSGRAIPCGRGQCAVLPSGKHVQGTVVDGRLMVRVP
jgi:flagella basal body P-ring formation protein FlgA